MAEAMEKQLILQVLNTVLLPCLSTDPQKCICTAWFFRRRRLISRSVLCGAVLFSLGLVSLFTGQIAADLEWSSRIRGRWRSKRLKSFFFTFDCNWFSFCTMGSTFRSDTGNQEICGNQNSLIFIMVVATEVLILEIIDAVVVAWILNATLVVPELDHHSFWRDDSDFANIFDVDWFISYLSKDVTIIKRIPDKIMRSMEKPPYTMRPPRKSTPEYYLDQVLPILLRRRAVQLTKFDYRLTNALDEELQKLRCRVNFHGLRFTNPIVVIAQNLVKRMHAMASQYVAIHLRFEPDMLAFSGCYFGGGEKERSELGEIRKRWETLSDLTAEGEQSRGKCPLTPHEVGLMLRALGFANDTHLYVASGEIYGGEKTLQPLKDLFPHFYTKEMLAGVDLQPFLPFSSRLAAIDYIVCYESDVFITNNNGNMAKILAGHRRYAGHRRTIRPNARRLSSLFKALHEMEWEIFSRKVRLVQRGFMGEPDEMRPGRGDFHEFPSSCVCQKPLQLEIAGLPRKSRANATLGNTESGR
ncbi:hypothetical protein ZIOFF_010262 [Zingiber officinale]|uniref:O-fucosyltransferase family protein n=1 Tax=Zingiber officinale TaxID=94328 RepID=A0A8J5HP71_ZINOF|nr:hypothetical protein ZIOFF_010262 [Zingiber officinale]